MMKTLLITVGAALTVFVAGSSALTAPARGVGAAPPVLPLSERDQRQAHGGGCQLAFNTERSTLLYAIGNELMLKTRAGRTVCPINDRQFSAFSGGGTRTCGGLRLNIRRTGRVTGNEASDSASFPATLTVTGRGRPWTVRGYWGTAC